jgi:hypothetical protein
MNQSYDKKLQYLRQRAEETVEDVDLLMKDEEDWDSKASERSVKRTQKSLEEFENDPIAYLERENAEDEKYLKKGIGNSSSTKIVKEGIAERQAIIDKLKAKETPKGKPILRSGGAEGADTVFEDAAMEAGHEVESMSFKGHNTKSKNRKKILPSLLKKADKFLKRANKTLKRFKNGKLPSYEGTRNLLRRNYYQVKDSDQIIAVAPLKYGSLTEVEGGTAWGIQMAIDLGKKDIHLYDLSKREWTKWVKTPKGARFLPAPAPVLGNNYTGIGSRPDRMTPEGEAAIKALYEKPKKLTNQEKAMGFEEGDIEASIAATEEMMEKEQRSDEIDNEIAMESEQVDKSTPKEEVDQSREKSKLKENEVQEDEVNEKIDVESDIFQERQDSQDFHYTEGQKNVLSKIVDYFGSKI